MDFSTVRGDTWKKSLFPCISSNCSNSWYAQIQQEILKSNDVKEQLESSHKKPLLEGEEYEALKRRLKERKKALQALPQFTLKSVGHEAEIGMHESYRTPLFMKDLQHLLLYALMGSKAPVEPSR